MTTVINMVECCSICIDNLDSFVLVTQCNHVFHIDCFNTWKKHSLSHSNIVRCPNCNYILEVAPVNNYSSPRQEVYCDSELLIALCVKSCVSIMCLFILCSTIFLAIKVSKLT